MAAAAAVAAAAADHAACGTGPVDWARLRDELTAYAEGPDLSTPMRWMALCITASWVARTMEVWAFCPVGAAVLALHAAFCAEPGPIRAEAYARVSMEMTPFGWAGFVIDSDWPIFESIAAQARDLSQWEPEERALLAHVAAVPEECEASFNAGATADASDSLRAEEVAETAAAGELMLTSAMNVAASDGAGGLTGIGFGLEEVAALEPVAAAATGLCREERLVYEGQEAAKASGFLASAACVLAATVRSGEGIRAALGYAEIAYLRCLPNPVSMVPALLQSRWPVAHLLAELHRLLQRRPRPPEGEESLSAVRRRPPTQPGALPGDGGLGFDRALRIGSVLLMVQLDDDVYPWVAPVARAVSPEELYAELPWPAAPAPSWEAVQAEALQLAETFAWTNFPSPSNDRGTWRCLCLVCSGGSQDPTTRNASAAGGYAKTPLLSSAPALERFIDLFGPTGRVRISGVAAGGGLIGWHPDDNVVESGRMILHIPLQTSPAALNRVGNLLFHMPEGVIHWADYSFPHTVYNAHSSVDRLHLIIDVQAVGNEAFDRNFLQRVPPDRRKRLLAAALPQGNAGSDGVGARWARPTAGQLSKVFSTFLGAQAARDLERSTWRGLVDALSEVVQRGLAGER
eukprot:TRINITY_DN27576_c0_g2_i1.p1 TRINITY_DN27576_c0_g2~~TRINITY_DN27576_c0_g2_i1.p1  ORF type:complete len:632 (-),score=140.26 TRINITY_DN27576_c0_g2_i1:18-1913(-)